MEAMIFPHMSAEQKADAWRALTQAGYEVDPQTGHAVLQLEDQRPSTVTLMDEWRQFWRGFDPDGAA